jgi:hypothetical protein
MYIGKVLLSDEWEKLEDLIQDQVSGQSAFAFDSEKTYQLQGEGVEAIRLCDNSAAPSALNDGERIKGTQTAFYKPSTGYLYTRVDLTEKTGMPDFGKVYLKISEIGE